ncbi:MAG: magnesium transporter, partial [Phycisphaerae bacterium]|nr:magnesium transporter [Phycisphaerae bacterium]
MNPEESLPPLEVLEHLVRQADVASLEEFLEVWPAAERARLISRLDTQDQSRLLTLLKPEDAADFVEGLSEEHAADMIERLPAAAAAAIVDELPSDDQADILGDLDRADAEAILAAMQPEEARDARKLSAYADDVAGGLMITEYLQFSKDMTVADVIDDLRANAEKYRDYELQYAYVTDTGGKLVGVLQLRDLLLADRSRSIAELMRGSPATILDTAELDQVRDFFGSHGFLGAPVVDRNGSLVGVISRSGAEEALAHRNEGDYLKSQGIVGGEELRTMPLMRRSGRRLSWLSVNILLNIMAASVIGFYQDTLSAVIALAVFLPIISDMSGCSGNQ